MRQHGVEVVARELRPIEYAADANCWRQSWPMLSSPRAAIPVADASPTCELCAQTTAFDCGPWKSSKLRSVRNMCRSRRFHDSAAP